MGDRLIAVDGVFVNERISQVVEAIHEYDDRIEVRYIPEGARADWQDAFQLVYHPDGQPEQVMFHVKNEEQFDIRVLKKIMMNDQAKGGGPTLSEMEAFDRAQAALQRQAFLDSMEEANDIAASVLRSPLSTYRISKDHVIKDYGNRSR